MDYPRRRFDLTTNDHEFADGSGSGLLVYDTRRDTGHVLNPATCAVFLASDGKTSREEIADQVARATGLPSDIEVVDLALAELDAAGLLDEPATVSGGLSRRSVIARLALGAAAVAALPLIESVARPDRADAGAPAISVLPKSATTEQGVPVDITLQSVNGAPNLDVLFWVVGQPQHGTVSVTGKVATFTPDPGFVGSDSFTYSAGQCFPLVDVVTPACPDGTSLNPPGGATPATVDVTVLAKSETTTTGVAPTTGAQMAAGTETQPHFTG